ncbi:unnamed protein product, partial [Musa acuminata subsp. malaccensis]
SVALSLEFFLLASSRSNPRSSIRVSGRDSRHVFDSSPRSSIASA